MITASALPRGFVCLASLVHKQAQYRTADTDAGNERHAAREAAINAGDYSVLPLEVAELLEQFTVVRAEVAYAYDAATGAARELGQGIQRKYEGLAPFEIPGTADVAAIALAEPSLKPIRGLIVDWKGHSDVEHPNDNKQTLHNALCLARIHGLDEVTVCIANEGRAPVFATLDAIDLDAFAIALHELQLQAAKAAVDPQRFEIEGDHCRHCNAQAACTKKQALARQVLNGDASLELDILLPLENDNQAMRAREFAERLRQMLKRLDAAIYTRAAERPIPTRDGKLFGKVVEAGNDELDPDITYTVVREMYGQEIADKAVHREAAKSWLEAALREAGAKPLATAQRKVIAEVVKRGGVKNKPTERWREFPPQLKAVNE